MQSDTLERRLFDLAVLAIDYYWPIQPLTQTKSIFLWLDGLSPLVCPSTNSKHTKSESHSNNCDMGKEGNKVSWTEEMPPTNSDYTESKTHDNICSKNYRNISNGVGVQKFLLDNSKGPIKNCDISKVGDEITWIEKMPLTKPNCIKSESHGDNCKNNHNSNRIGGEKQRSDNLEGPK